MEIIVNDCQPHCEARKTFECALYEDEHRAMQFIKKMRTVRQEEAKQDLDDLFKEYGYPSWQEIEKMCTCGYFKSKQ